MSIRRYRYRCLQCLSVVDEVGIDYGPQVLRRRRLRRLSDISGQNSEDEVIKMCLKFKRLIQPLRIYQTREGLL